MRAERMTTESMRALLEGGRRVAALVPVGSVEPHGPHLPLGTDTVISEAAADRAVGLLAARQVSAIVAPAVPYGVTHYASGFAGAVSVNEDALQAFLRAVARAWLDAGCAHVCLVNNHLEPEHDATVRRAVAEGFVPGSTSVASPLTRRWARTLSAEFKSGACHAGRYETSLVLAASPAAVDMDAARSLPDLDISLSRGIAEGKTTFASMGIERAYTGSPSQASAAEGEALLALLAEMIAGEVSDALALLGGATGAPA
jgi:creatinine amidohydrolase